MHKKWGINKNARFFSIDISILLWGLIKAYVSHSFAPSVIKRNWFKTHWLGVRCTSLGVYIYCIYLFDGWLVLSLPLNRCQWSCCIRRMCWQTHFRNIWCNMDAHPWAHNVVQLSFRRIASNRNDRNASPGSWLSCIHRWKLTRWRGREREKNSKINMILTHELYTKRTNLININTWCGGRETENETVTNTFPI